MPPDEFIFTSETLVNYIYKSYLNKTIIILSATILSSMII